MMIRHGNPIVKSAKDAALARKNGLDLPPRCPHQYGSRGPVKGTLIEFQAEGDYADLIADLRRRLKDNGIEAVVRRKPRRRALIEGPTANDTPPSCIWPASATASYRPTSEPRISRRLESAVALRKPRLRRGRVPESMPGLIKPQLALEAEAAGRYALDP